MADRSAYTFRTALSGFNRADVSAYIAKTAAAHQAELEDLRQELESLRQENLSLRQELETLSPAPEAEPVPEEPPEVPEETPEVPEETPETPEELLSGDLRELELEAYRRAEAAERRAYTRADRMYRDMQAIYTRSAETMERSDRDASGAVVAIEDQLETLRQSLSALMGTLQGSAKDLEDLSRLPEDPELPSEEA